MSKQLVVATTNQHKLAEIKAILALPDLELLSLRDFPTIPPIVEDGKTYVANAFIKAEAAWRVVQVPVLADDSGLEVEVLDGAPGIYSARYAGQGATDAQNNAKLLDALLGKTQSQQAPHRARFVCALVLYRGPNAVVETIGRCEGVISPQPAGCGGFGYDPLFIPDGYAVSMAELSAEEKNRISHRAKALRALHAHLRVLA